ncbi:MAG: polysaccharide pyruvyl transferase family protein [FCB group bacterium]|nr:polysaccharide pyruvyl transferase family protein [FCB group bacterium]
MLRSVAKRVGFAWLRGRRMLTPSRVRRVLILPPAPTGGSLGDEAMICAITSVLGQDRSAKVDLLLPDGASHWDFVPGVEKQIGGFDILYSLDTGNLFKLYGIISRYDGFYCLGADVMDGHYYVWRSVRMLALLRIAAGLGLDARLLGFSWSHAADPSIVAEFRKLPSKVKVFVRDPVSYRRFQEEAGVKATPVADVAFLLTPDTDSQRLGPLRQWVRAEKENGRVVLGVNIAAHAFGIDSDEAVSRVATSFAEALNRVRAAMPELSVVVMPHDRRDVPGYGSDLRAGRDLMQRLASTFGDRAAVLPADITAAEMKAAAAQMDLVLTSRMHLAIAALGSEVPVACIPYLGKFEGLLEHFGLDGITIEPEQALDPEALSSFLLSVLPRRADLRNRIAARLPAVREMALLNLGD